MTSHGSILLAIRTGAASRGPARTAAWLAQAMGARVTVVYVAQELETAPAVASGAGVDLDEVREKMRADARQRAAELAAELLGDGAFDVVVAEGDVAEEVAAAAERLGADLLVVGSQGRSTVRSVILGDTTQSILRRAHCPVVVVPPGVGED
jgi:nucleotide-binding universal stress UspA family protein